MDDTILSECIQQEDDREPTPGRCGQGGEVVILQQDESKREQEQGDGDNFQKGIQSTPPSQHQYYWERARSCAPLQTLGSLAV